MSDRSRIEGGVRSARNRWGTLYSLVHDGVVARRAEPIEKMEYFFAVFLALCLGLLLSAVFGIRGPWAVPWAIFLLLFLLIWAGGVWITPVGPPVYGIYWFPFLVTGLIVVLFVAAAGSERSRFRTRGEAVAEERAEAVGITIYLLGARCAARPRNRDPLSLSRGRPARW